MKFSFISAIYLLLPIFSFHVGASNDLVDMCPKLPDEIESKRPLKSEYVINDSSKVAQIEQENNYRSDLHAFKKKYEKEILLVDKKWDDIYSTYSESRKKFYSLALYGKLRGAAEEAKASCWEKIMGINEMEEDNVCHPTTSPPSKLQWNDILICSIERIELIKLAQ